MKFKKEEVITHQQILDTFISFIGDHTKGGNIGDGIEIHVEFTKQDELVKAFARLYVSKREGKDEYTVLRSKIGTIYES